MICGCPGGVYGGVCPPCLTSPEHVLSLQQLDNGRLRGGDQDDAAVLSAAHQATLRGDVNAGRHLEKTTGVLAHL